jgi:hypothetical protein
MLGTSPLNRIVQNDLPAARLEDLYPLPLTSIQCSGFGQPGKGQKGRNTTNFVTRVDINVIVV